MNTYEASSLTGWTPDKGFNILDFRDLENFPQYYTPPYVLKFNFTNTMVLEAIVVDFMGWNIPECGSNTLFSKIQISKNGFEDIYYNKPGGKMGENNMTFKLENKMILSSPKDVLLVSFFPLCPVHMMDIGRIIFIDATTPRNTPTTTTPPTSGQQSTTNDPLNILLNPKPLDPYWYLYATLFSMVILLLLSLLFMSMKSKKKHYIILRTKK